MFTAEDEARVLKVWLATMVFGCSLLGLAAVLNYMDHLRGGTNLD